ncbi:hypothetical protein LZ30DRAFT_599450 [Colletotrichum cereale]|nr:hypothetical protein LZ30DRAFT_599450 [Colletotrichum cereale]
MSIRVYIAIYHVYDERDPNHWAIFLGQNEREVILQIGDDKGAAGYFVEEPIYNKQPQRSNRHKESVAVGSIDSSNFDAIVAIIQNTPVDNISNTWNCQAWIIEALDNLSNLGLFQWDQRSKQMILQKRQHWQ